MKLCVMKWPEASTVFVPNTQSTFDPRFVQRLKSHSGMISKEAVEADDCRHAALGSTALYLSATEEVLKIGLVEVCWPVVFVDLRKVIPSK